MRLKISISTEMPQGNMKVKAKLAKNMKRSSIHRGKHVNNKVPKKAKITGVNQRLQKEVEKVIRMNIEDEMRAKAQNDGKQVKSSKSSK